MTSIIVDIPVGKKPEQYRDIFATLASGYDVEELEDFMLGLHMSKNDPTGYMPWKGFPK